MDGLEEKILGRGAVGHEPERQCRMSNICREICSWRVYTSLRLPLLTLCKKAPSIFLPRGFGRDGPQACAGSQPLAARGFTTHV